MKVSILEWNIIYWVDYSTKWAEVFDIEDSDFEKIKSWTHIMIDRDVIETPIIESLEKTEEELAEIEAKELAEKQESILLNIKDMIATKRAMEIVWENTDTLVSDITLASEEYINNTTATKSEKTALKSSILEKL